MTQRPHVGHHEARLDAPTRPTGKVTAADRGRLHMGDIASAPIRLRSSERPPAESTRGTRGRRRCRTLALSSSRGHTADDCFGDQAPFRDNSVLAADEQADALGRGRHQFRLHGRGEASARRRGDREGRGGPHEHAVDHRPRVGDPGCAIAREVAPRADPLWRAKLLHTSCGTPSRPHCASATSGPQPGRRDGSPCVSSPCWSIVTYGPDSGMCSTYRLGDARNGAA